jgi:predicted membrane protein
MADPGRPNDNQEQYAGMSNWRRRRYARRGWACQHGAGYVGRRSPAFGLAFSLLLILGGIAFFLDSLDLFRLQHLWRYWPLALIALGVSKLSGPPRAIHRAYAALFIFEGVFFQLATLGIIPLRPGTVGPLLSIGCGVLLLVQHLQRRDLPDDNAAGSTRSVDSSGNVLHHIAVFSGVKRRIEAQDFEGGDLLTVFGNIELDLRKAAIMPTGGAVTIDNTTVFGAINLRIPETWVVVVHGLAVFGAYEDKTVPPRPPAGTESPRLVLTGFTVFGAVTVEN